MTENNNTPNEIDVPEVDEGKITRKSMLDGAWAGMKKGLMWSGIGSGVIAGVAGLFSLTLAKTAVGAVLGNWVTGTAAVLFGGKVLSDVGATGLAFQTMGSVLTSVAAIAIPLLAAGAVIGAVVGAVKGYNGADTKIELAHRQVKQEMRQLAMEKQQTERLQQQATDATQQLYANNEPQIGQFQPASTPNLNNNGVVRDS